MRYFGRIRGGKGGGIGAGKTRAEGGGGKVLEDEDAWLKEKTFR